MRKIAIRRSRAFRLALTTSVAGFAMLTTGAAFAEDAPQGAASSPQSEIIVTGTRRSDRTVANSVTPIDVVSADALRQQGFTDTNDLLRSVVPSLQVQTFSQSSYAVAIRPFSLRGLSPDQTLVLVNGQRWHRSALVQLSRLPLSSGAQGPDLSMIPSIALQRVEVLRDGASAQYGSDAIAGVVDFQLRRDRSGVEVDSKFGQYYKGDGRTYDEQANVGIALPNEGFINVSGQYVHSGFVNRARQRADAAALIASGNTAIADPAQIVGEPRNEQELVFVNAEQPINDAITLYAFGNYGNHIVDAGQYYRNPDPNGSRKDIFASVPLTDQPGGERFTFASLYPGGLLPIQTYRVQDQSYNAGVKGDVLPGLHYDVGGSIAKDSARFGIYDTVNPSLGPTAPTDYYSGTQVQREQQIHGDFSYEWDTGIFAKPLNIAFGGEYRHESFQIRPGDPASYEAGPFARVFDPDTGQYVGLAIGASGFPGFAPDQAGRWGRSNEAGYIDLETDLVKGLSVGFAGRYESFSDFGDTFNWKASARYQFTPWFALRGSYNTAFRAPTPGQEHISAQSTSINTATGGLLVVETVPVNSPIAAYYGAKPLKPEKSKNFSVGGVVDLPNGLLFTLDYYNVKIKNRLGVTSNITISAADRAALTALGQDVSQLSSVAFFANAFDTTTQGIDAVLTKNWHFDDVSFSLSGALNYNKTHLDRIRFPLAVDRERQIEISTYYPRWHGTITGTASKGPWSLMARVEYFSKFTDAVSAVSATSYDQTYGSNALVDMELSYDVNKHLQLAVGGNNIFDRYPGKESLPANTSAGIVYTQNSPFGSDGGFWYVRARMKF